MMSSRILTSLVLGSLVGLGPAGTPPEAAETVVTVGSFRSLTLRNGGGVILPHGSTQKVTIRQGGTDYMTATIEDGNRLVIDHCPGHCPEGYRLVVEIFSPNLDDIRVSDGGTIETRGGFPRQSTLRAGVTEGGTIDLRALTVDAVTATVEDGGRIYTDPQKTLDARVARGGGITYWGSAKVTSKIEKGGVVAPGLKSDANRPLQDFGPGGPAQQPVPPIQVREAQ